MLRIEMIENRGVDGGEILKRSSASQAELL